MRIIGIIIIAPPPGMQQLGSGVHVGSTLLREPWGLVEQPALAAAQPQAYRGTPYFVLLLIQSFGLKRLGLQVSWQNHYNNPAAHGVTIQARLLRDSVRQKEDGAQPFRISLADVFQHKKCGVCSTA